MSDLTATEIVARIASDTISAQSVARAHVERILERDQAVMAWQAFDPDCVLAQARRIDAGQISGHLSGVPFGVKDIIDTADLPTEYGSPIYRGHRPRRDAACVALGRKAGGILMGKTVTTEFANFHPGKTRNPLDPSRTPGGSSSGSAAAVADHMVPLAIGTQTTASVIRPASYCGIFGYRPTYGDLRCSGVMEASGSLDTLGLFARSIADIALYRNVLLGVTPSPVKSGPSAPRIGFCRSPLWSRVDAPTQSLVEEAARRLANSGAHLSEVRLPAAFNNAPDLHLRISSFEFSRNFTWEIENHWTEISQTLREGRLKAGLACGFEEYRQAMEAAADLRRTLDGIFDDFDVMITAAATGEAPVGLQSTGDPSQCLIWTMMHVPAMTLPVFCGPNSMPIGLQVIARRGDDVLLFSAAEWIYRVLS